MTDLAYRPPKNQPPTTRAGSSPQLSALAVHDRGAVVVTVTGELDLASAPGFTRDVLGLLALPVEMVILDLGALTFMDSSGLSALNRIRVATDDRGVTLKLRCLPDQARRLLDITEMKAMFECI